MANDSQPSDALAGAKVFKVKRSTLKKIRACADLQGAKQLGHGKVILAADSAIEAIGIVRATLQTVLERDPPPDPRTILQLMQLQLDFNRQLINASTKLAADEAES
jgi:hypothetical protein